MSNDVFSIEINEKYTRMADLQMDSNKIELISIGFDETIPNFLNAQSDDLIDRQVKIITQLYSNLKIVKRKVNAVISDSMSYSMIVELPMLKESELLSSIRYQADEFIPLPIEEVYLDIETLTTNPKTNKQTALIVASPKTVIDQVHKTLQKSALMPNSIENELSSVGRFISEILKLKNETSLIINFGYTSTTLYLVEPQSSAIVMTRSFKIGLELIVRDLKVNLNWDDKKIIEALKTIGLYDNGTINMATMTFPIVKEFIKEVQQFITLSQTKQNLIVKKIYTLNLDNHIGNFPKVVENFIKIPTASLSINAVLKPNIVSQTFAHDLSSFVSVISAVIR